MQKAQQWSFGGSKRTHELGEFSRLSPQSTQASDELPQPWISAFEEGIHPFFVVTKSDVVINAGDTIHISLGICPLVTGDLDVVGVRFRKPVETEQETNLQVKDYCFLVQIMQTIRLMKTKKQLNM